MKISSRPSEETVELEMRDVLVIDTDMVFNNISGKQQLVIRGIIDVPDDAKYNYNSMLDFISEVTHNLKVVT